MTDAVEPAPRARIAIQGLVLLGGICALSWQVLWQLESCLALGASALGTAITLAATMAGMTAGSLTMGRVLSRATPAHPFRLYGALELLIGLSGLLMVPGFGLLESIDTALYQLTPAAAPALHALGIALLLGPPTFAMGATIPVFQLVARQYGVPVSVLYGLNTAGAALGAMIVSLALLPNFGVRASCLLTAVLNGLVFLATWLVARPRRPPAPAAAASSIAPAGRIDYRRALAVVFGTGFITFALEIAWFRSLRAAFHSTTDSFAVMLTAVLIPLAVGARLVPIMRRRGIGPAPVLGIAGTAILLSTPLVERLDLFTSWPWNYWAYVGIRLGFSLAVLAPAMVFLGMALPWTLEEFPKPSQGGRLYAVNTLGAVLGALIGAWVLLPSIGFTQSSWLLGSATLVMAFFLVEPQARMTVVGAGVSSLAVAAAMSSAVGRDRVQGFAGFSREPYRIVAVDEGPDFTVSVVALRSGPRNLVIDGFIATTEVFTASYMEWMGRLPMLLHPDPKNTLVICFGTGQTAHAVRDEGPEHLDIVDISPAVIGLAAHFPSNHGVMKDPRVHAHVMDGRAWLRRNERLYDVITLEPMPPNFSGVNSLYSREFYEIMASRLTPGGVAAQWVPIHQLTIEHAPAVVATWRAVFPDSVLWFDPVGRTGILLGRRAPVDGPLGARWPGLERRAVERSHSEEEIRRALALDVEDLERYAASGVEITDDNQLLAYRLQDRWPHFPPLALQRNLQEIAAVRGSYPYTVKQQGSRKEDPRDPWPEALLDIPELP